MIVFNPGDRVVYPPTVGDPEAGTIVRQSDDPALWFVTYDGGTTPKATRGTDLKHEDLDGPDIADDLLEVEKREDGRWLLNKRGAPAGEAFTLNPEQRRQLLRMLIEEQVPPVKGFQRHWPVVGQVSLEVWQEYDEGYPSHEECGVTRHLLILDANPALPPKPKHGPRPYPETSLIREMLQEDENDLTWEIENESEEEPEET